jgi:PAS domain S-box-containing protein
MYLCEPDQDQVRCVVSYNTLRDYQGIILKYGEGAAGTVAQTGAPLIIDDYRVWSKRSAAYEQEQPFTSVLVVPLIWQGRVTGTLDVLGDVASRRFTQADLELLARFADHAAIAVENARLYEQAHREIRERVQAEEMLREQKSLLDEVFNGIHEGIGIVDENEIITLCNPAYAELFGEEVDSLVGKSLLSFFDDRGRSIILQQTRERQMGKTSTYELPLTTASGARKYARFTVSPRFTKDESYVGAFGAALDITERVRTEEALRESESRLRAVFETAQDPIFIKDSTLRYTQVNPATEKLYGLHATELLGRTDPDLFGEEAAEHLKEVDSRVLRGEIVEEEHVKAVGGVPATFHLIKMPMRNRSGEITGLCGIARDITEHQQAEAAVRQRNRELALLNRATRALAASLELDDILATILEEVRHMLEVVGSTIWLIEPETSELVCQQATGPYRDSIRGWRLALGQGLAGWTALRGESLIVPDTRHDDRHFTGVDEHTGLTLRSILSVPLRIKEKTIGVLQLVDTAISRFSAADQALVELLAATAAIAIENARLYEQARRDAETRAVLLREVNHRVKNNLTAIIGMLYAERHRTLGGENGVYPSAMQDLVNRVQGLATVHSLLSASEWAPVPLGVLAAQIIRSALQMLPRDKRVSVHVSPSPVHVTPERAHHLALVINELTTNTVKYALVERDTAQITVQIELDANIVRFVFRDDGPGYPDHVLRMKRHNVGFELIRNIVHKDLRGKLAIHNDHGTVAVIEFRDRPGENGR